MGVKYILNQFGTKIGLSPNTDDSRAVMLRFLNEAADELYNECDPSGSLTEQLFRVNGNQTITMPADVGMVRFVREYTSHIPIHINQMLPRYAQYNWKDAWYNFRIKNVQALQRSISNQAQVMVTVSEVEDPPIVVSIAGPTENADNRFESITMDEISKTGSVPFIDIVSATKNRVGICNVTITDLDDNILTVIPNNKLEARYQILDISQAPWLSANTDTKTNYVEILYKKSLTTLSNDTDEFPAAGYDNQLVNKCLQLWFEEQGKPELAIAYDAKATRGLARKKEDQNRSTEDMVMLVANPHDHLAPRLRRFSWRRWRGYRGT